MIKFKLTPNMAKNLEKVVKTIKQLCVEHQSLKVILGLLNNS